MINDRQISVGGGKTGPHVTPGSNRGFKQAQSPVTPGVAPGVGSPKIRAKTQPSLGCGTLPSGFFRRLPRYPCPSL